jgi:hypothetical protein
MMSNHPVIVALRLAYTDGYHSDKPANWTMPNEDYPDFAEKREEAIVLLADNLSNQGVVIN